MEFLERLLERMVGGIEAEKIRIASMTELFGIHSIQSPRSKSLLLCRCVCNYRKCNQYVI
jgi:hypothetical protein